MRLPPYVISLLLALGLTSALAAGPTGAQEAAEGLAWVRMAKGAVEVRSAGIPPKPFRPLRQVGHRLSSGDTIRTGLDGRAVVQFTDGSRIYCFEETEFTITEGERARTVLGIEMERYRSRLVEVERGNLGVSVEPNERLPTEVQSPTVVVGVRGTVIDPFQVDRTTGETRVGLRRGQAWGYTPNGQAAFEMVPGLLARLGRDAKGRPTVLSEAGPLGLITRDHRITLKRDQGVFLDLKTAAGRAVIGAVPKSVGRVVVEAGGNRAQLVARQVLETRIDRKAGRLTMEALRGKLPLTDTRGRKLLLRPGKPFGLKFTPPAFEPRLIPGPKIRRRLPKPPAGSRPPALGVPKLPGLKRLPPKVAPPRAGPKPPPSSPLKRLLRKAIPLAPSRSPRAPAPEKGKGSWLPQLKPKPALKSPFFRLPGKAPPRLRTPAAKPPPAPRRPSPLRRRPIPGKLLPR